MTAVFAAYLTAPKIVRAAQLTEDTADDICRWTLGYRLGPDRWIASEGCWRVSALRWYPPVSYLRGLEEKRPYIPNGVLIGLRTRKGEEIAAEGSWIVQGEGGAFGIIHPDNFGDLYTAADR